MPKAEKSTSRTNLKTLYTDTTNDTTSHQRTIHMWYLRLNTHQQGMIAARLEGESYRAIGDKYQVTAASARESILRGLERIRKAIAEEPRYNKVGRKHAGGDF
jgi:DNA-directed RNA polymerase specialized sigma24 family protein